MLASKSSELKWKKKIFRTSKTQSDQRCFLDVQETQRLEQSASHEPHSSSRCGLREISVFSIFFGDSAKENGMLHLLQNLPSSNSGFPAPNDGSENVELKTKIESKNVDFFNMCQFDRENGEKAKRMEIVKKSRVKESSDSFGVRARMKIQRISLRKSPPNNIKPRWQNRTKLINITKNFSHQEAGTMQGFREFEKDDGKSLEIFKSFIKMFLLNKTKQIKNLTRSILPLCSSEKREISRISLVTRKLWGGNPFEIAKSGVPMKPLKRFMSLQRRNRVW